MSDAAIERKGMIGPWQAILAFVLLWIALMVAGPLVRGFAMPYFNTSGTRNLAAFRALFSIVFDWAALGATLVILRLRGQRLADLGWRKRAGFWGWAAAAAVAAFFVWGSFFAQIRPGVTIINHTLWLTDWSSFRILAAVGIGITSGICEETMFRGFVMTQARDGRAPVIVQILLAALLFGLVHIGWGGLSGHFDARQAFGAALNTTIFGFLFAIVYLLSRRSLMPAIMGHTMFNIILEPWMILFAIQGGFAMAGH